MKKFFCLFAFWGLWIGLIGGDKDYGADDRPYIRTFIEPKYGDEESDLEADLLRSDDMEIEFSIGDERCIRIIVLVLITKDGNPKVLNINGKDCTEKSSMNQLETYVMQKIESDEMRRWHPASLNGTPVDYTYMIGVCL